MNTRETLSELESILNMEGPRAALAYLNAQAGHRFTGMYRYELDAANALAFFDRENPEMADPGDLAHIPVEVTYCTYVVESGRPFHITDALTDDRVMGHPSRETVRAYCGVPLRDKEGKIFGTLCHFDFKPMPVPEGHMELLEALSPLIEKHGRMTHTPRRRVV